MAEHLPEARGLGDALAELIDEPEAFVAVLREGLSGWPTRPYAPSRSASRPGSGVVFGVRGPLLAAVTRQLRKPLAEIVVVPARCGWPTAWSTEPEREIELFALRRACAARCPTIPSAPGS